MGRGVMGRTRAAGDVPGSKAQAFDPRRARKRSVRHRVGCNPPSASLANTVSILSCPVLAGRSLKQDLYR